MKMEGAGRMPLVKPKDANRPIKVIVCGIQTSEIFYRTWDALISHRCLKPQQSFSKLRLIPVSFLLAIRIRQLHMRLRQTALKRMIRVREGSKPVCTLLHRHIFILKSHRSVCYNTINSDTIYVLFLMRKTKFHIITKQNRKFTVRLPIVTFLNRTREVKYSKLNSRTTRT
jgi:hypothetical protein